MNKELALRTFAYLIGHYKTHNETTINKQEIEAIEFILKDNEFLKQQCKKQKGTIDKAIEYIETCNPNVELHSEFLDESYLSNYGAKELLDILKGDSNERR